MSTYVNYLLKKGHSKKTTTTYQTNLYHYIQWTEEENIEAEFTTYNEVLSYLQHLKKRGLKQTTIQLHLISLKHYFSWLISLEKLAHNPVNNITLKGVKKKRLYHALKKQELEQLYHNYPIPNEANPNNNQNWFKASLLTSKRNKIIVGLIIYQGLTTIELSKLKVEDVNLREGKIHVPGTRKSNERTLALEANQILEMMEYTIKLRQELLTITNKQTDILLISSGVSHRFNNIMQQLLKKLKAQNNRVTSLQQLRTSVIVYWLKIHNLRQVQYMAGHRYVSSTESYLINDLEGLQEDITKFHPIG